MKRIIAMFLSLCAVLSFAACGQQENTESTSTGSPEKQTTADAGTASSTATAADDPFADLDPVKWTFSTQTTANATPAKIAHWIADEVSTRTNGKFTLDVYTDAVLYSDRECIEALQAGSIDAGQGSYATMAKFAPLAGATSLPYLFESWDDLYDFCFGSEAVQLVWDAIQKDAGVVPLSCYSSGFRHVTNNKRPIYTLDDFVGIKIRVQQSDLYIATFEALGAYPVAMAASEIATALQQGTVDAQENPLDTFYGDGNYEFQKYLSMTGHIASFSGYYVSQKSWDALPDAYKEIYTEVTEEAARSIMETAQSGEAEYIELLKEKGMEINEVSEDNLAAFKSVCKEEVWPQFEDQYSDFLALMK